MKGIHREIQKIGKGDLNGYLESARAAQGLHEYSQTPPETRRYIIDRWRQLKIQPPEKKSRVGFSGKKAEKKEKYPEAKDLRDYRAESTSDYMTAENTRYHRPEKSHYDDDDDEMNRAIRASLEPENRTVSSRGPGPIAAAAAAPQAPPAPQASHDGAPAAVKDGAHVGHGQSPGRLERRYWVLADAVARASAARAKAQVYARRRHAAGRPQGKQELDLEADCRVFPGSVEWDAAGTVLYQAEGKDDAVDG